MRNIKLTLEYDGERFLGFQRQPGKRTVQSELEKAFRRIFRKKIKISSASGRTDAGVHAKGQVVNFKMDSSIPARNIQRALNTYLPEDLSVREAKEVPENFHARFLAKTKHYEYAVWNSKARSPLKRNYSYHFPYKLNINLMKKAASDLIGKHNFRSFQAQANSNGKNSARTIYRLQITKQGNEVRFLVEGDGFLYNMVRNMVGTLLMVGIRKISLDKFKQIFKKHDRRHIGFTAPAHGLTLFDVKYKKTNIS